MLSSFRTGQTLMQVSANRKVVALGNAVKDAHLWCCDLQSFESSKIFIDDLEVLEDADPLSWDQLVARMEERGASGDSQALWWVAWAYEDTNHPKSVWYYIAAMRCDPDRHGWALGRVAADARSPVMEEGVPRPSLDFLELIPEFNGATHWGLWQEAVESARFAKHLAASPQETESDSWKRVRFR